MVKGLPVYSEKCAWIRHWKEATDQLAVYTSRGRGSEL